MSPLYFIKILYFLSSVSVKFICCKLYSDPASSHQESCAAKDKHACESGVYDAKSDGPTFIGRDGLKRLDGIKVSSFTYSLTDIALGVNTDVSQKLRLKNQFWR